MARLKRWYELEAGSTWGIWRVEAEGRSFILIRSRDDLGSAWKILPAADSYAKQAAEWLYQNGLKESRFPTRREAFTRFQDAL